MPARPRGLVSAVELQILLALAEGPKHGYAIKRDVEQRTEGALHLGPGTLYEAIQRLRGSRWIEEAPDGAAAGVLETGSARGAPRRTYRLTQRGRAGLGRELGRLAALLDQARALRLVPGDR